VSRRFEGKVVLVTGANSGIGRAAAELFAADGASVVLAGRRAERGESVARAIRESGGEATFFRADVADARSVELLIEQAVRRYGRIDCAFNNAGVAGETFKDTASQSEETWNEVININLRGVWLCMKYELPHMQRQGGGAIVNTASIYAHEGSDFGIAPYVASKHGVVGLTRAAAVEFASRGVRVNAISPGITLTEMTAPGLQAAREEFTANVRQRVPLARMAEPVEIARAALWLCSDEAAYVTGATLPVDGGWLVR
jgi:A-factor type gamma-butyrolactone 1'-reductase (1S-forming)